MGLTYNQVRELFLARSTGASFQSVLTVGHQNLYLHPRELRALRAEFGFERELRATPRFGDYADEFLRETLGVGALSVIDISDFEGATHLHDLNAPVPAELHDRFDAVIDGGSLEHVFNVPVALANLMRMTKTGGRLVVCTPANNLCGHGFYQFSPEFAYRALGESQGFVVRRVALIEAVFPGLELAPAKRAFDVVDPDEVKDRVTLVTRRPVELLMHGEKVKHVVEPFADPPQQSDYELRWREGRPHFAVDAPGSTLRSRVRRWVPPPLWRRMRGYRQRLSFSTRNGRFYQRIK